VRSGSATNRIVKASSSSLWGGIAVTSARSAYLLALSDDLDATNGDDETDRKPAIY